MSSVLKGRRILVTRPAAQAGPLVARIEAAGGKAVCFPLLEIGPVNYLTPLRQAAQRLGDFAIAIFISPNAVEHALPLLLSGGEWPATLRAAAIGQSTAALLAAHGVNGVIAPTDRFDSEAVLTLPAFQAEAVAGQQVLILRGNGGRELLADTLRARGAGVECVSCYRRSPPKDAAALTSLLHNKQLDALTISSSEGLRNLWSLLDTEARGCLQGLPLFVPHERIGEQAAELGLRRVVMTAPADAGILQGLEAFDWGRT